MTRKESNIVLLKTLEMLIEKYPDMRFGQILFNFGFLQTDHFDDKKGKWLMKDPFYEEPEITIDRVKETIHRQAEDA